MTLREKLIYWLKDNPQEIHWSTLGTIKKNVERAGILTTLSEEQWEDVLMLAGYARVRIADTFHGYIIRETEIAHTP